MSRLHPSRHASSRNGALEHPVEVAELLWPAPARVRATRRTGRRAAAQWFVLPSASRPRLMVPVGVPAAARMLVRHGDRPGPRAVRALLATAVRTGLLDRVPVLRLAVEAPPGSPSLAGELAPVLGEGLVLGALLGTPRVNRKPVLQVFDASGATVAFVKGGHDDRTRWLVRREAENLARLHRAGLTRVALPEVLHVGSFGALEVLVLSPLRSSQEEGRQGVVPPPLDAMAELAGVAGQRRAPLGSGAHGARLERLAATGRTTRQQERLGVLARRVLDEQGQQEVHLGAWHGDWAPWNMGWIGDRLEVWDWERYAEDVPLGFDLVHFLSQRVRHDQPELRAAEDALLADLPDLLPSVGVPAEQTRLTVVLYLLELAGRFLRPEDGPAVADHPRARWALDLAERLVGGMDTPTGEPAA